MCENVIFKSGTQNSFGNLRKVPNPVRQSVYEGLEFATDALGQL